MIPFGVLVIARGSSMREVIGKRLFMLRNKNDNTLVKDENGNDLYFSNKMIAKQHRQVGQVVTYGIDHNRYKGGKR
tara:strand:- start:2095 stop:2322 length:228 start_codon:yes stop_codon:yes gene_type:complete